MLNDLIAHIAKINGVREPIAKQALGIVLNAADRQASPFADALFRALPGARPLAAKAGAKMGAPSGEIARLIEQTPGGRSLVIQQMIRQLHKIGFDHAAVGTLLPSISLFASERLGLTGFGHLGDVIGQDDPLAEPSARAA